MDNIVQGYRGCKLQNCWINLVWCTSIFEVNKALTKTFDRIVLGTVLMVRYSHSTVAATTLAPVTQQLQHCTRHQLGIL